MTLIVRESNEPMGANHGPDGCACGCRDLTGCRVLHEMAATHSRQQCDIYSGDFVQERVRCYIRTDRKDGRD